LHSQSGKHFTSFWQKVTPEHSQILQDCWTAYDITSGKNLRTLVTYLHYQLQLGMPRIPGCLDAWGY